MSPQQSNRPLTQFAIKDLIDNKKSFPIESKPILPLTTKDGHCPNQPGAQNKRALTPEPEKYRKRMRGSMKDLVLGVASQSSQDLNNALTVRRESPWDTFIKVYECDLAGRCDMAIPRVRPGRLVAIRTIKENKVDQVLCLLNKLQHPNILSFWECFLHEGSAFILHDDIPVSLDHIVACEAYLDEVELAAILSQVLDGLLYLTAQQIEHPRFSSSNVLVTTQGVVKIAGLEECVELQRALTPPYSKQLKVITMELMQKYEKEDNKTGVDDVGQWPCDSYATGFLSSLESEVSIKKLRDVSSVSFLK